jgi:uncharacterized protein (DUF305 family)
MEKGANNMHMGMMGMDKMKGEPATTMDHSKMSMDQMTEGLKGLQGDAFDKAFIEMMIAHHQGAVDMANAIPGNAKHAELKRLGTEIITAQTKEIEMMKGWLKTWGYTNDAMMKGDMKMEGMDHSQMGM